MRGGAFWCEEQTQAWSRARFAASVTIVVTAKLTMRTTMRTTMTPIRQVKIKDELEQLIDNNDLETVLYAIAEISRKKLSALCLRTTR